MFKNIKSSKIFTSLAELQRNSKSRVVRGAVMEMVHLIADKWPVDMLRKCSGKIRELTDVGIVDAGPNAREATKEALIILNKKMPDVNNFDIFNIKYSF
jgi:hypothetical protein